MGDKKLSVVTGIRNRIPAVPPQGTPATGEPGDALPSAAAVGRGTVKRWRGTCRAIRKS